MPEDIKTQSQSEKIPQSERPLIVQSDQCLLVEVQNQFFEECRLAISFFSELEKSPEYLHVYRVTPLSLWNAAAAGHKASDIIGSLEKYSKYPLPQAVVFNINQQIQRYGKLRLEKDEIGNLYLVSTDAALLLEILKRSQVANLVERIDEDNTRVRVKKAHRGKIKQTLISFGFPVKDLAGYDEGIEFTFNFRNKLIDGRKFELRKYQHDSIRLFHANGQNEGGSGVIVLPCGAGKTVVGIGVMQLVGTRTLILATNTLSVRQWRQELLEKTDIEPSDIGEYSGEVKEIRPITIATYNILTHRKTKNDKFTHFNLFSADSWGLIIYDEVHLLPARVFRTTSELQSKRRLGLTATLVREDGLEEDVFTLIGPKKYDIYWKNLEDQKWIAKATCTEVRVSMDESMRNHYSVNDNREKYRIASENPNKIIIIERIIQKHGESNVLIIGQYLNQLEAITRYFGYPLITGSTPIQKREEVYSDFKDGKLPALIVSKVANFSINLPDARLAIQVSGSFGSRQEEAQRLGRILRPKKGLNESYFYSLITTDSVEEQFGRNRQLFLTEQGYTYRIFDERDYLTEKELEKFTKSTQDVSKKKSLSV